MTSRNNIPRTARDFYFTPAGNSDWDGLSLENALPGPSDAITKINALSPPPDAANPASLNAAQTGTYFNTPVIIPDWVSCSAGVSSLIETDNSSICVTSGDAQNVEWGALINSGDNATGYLINGKTRVRVDLNTIVMGPFSGASSSSNGFHTSGALDDVFINAQIIEVRSTDGAAILHEAATTTPVNYIVNAIELFSDNSLALTFNSPNDTDIGVFHFGTVRNDATLAPTGTGGFNIMKGCPIITASLVDANVGIYVAAGAKLTIDCLDMKGAIIVEPGGELICNILNHDGFIVPLGEINGNIGGTGYGTYADSNEGILTFFMGGNIPPNWRTVGRFTLDMTVYKLDDVAAYYRQTRSGSRSVNFRMIDSDTSDVYYEATNTDTVSGIKTMTVTVDKAIPSSVVNFDIQFERDTFGTGVIEAGAQIEYSEI